MSARDRGAEVATPLSMSVVVALGAVVCVVAWLSVLGSDALWLSALGDTIRADRQIPTGVPFAAAPSDGWVNTTALGQVLFSVIHGSGSLGVVAAQVLAVAATLWILVSSAGHQGARVVGLVSVMLLVLVGGAAPLLIARAQLLSLVPYAVLLVLLRREHDHPSRLIWAAVPLIALWGNLHGAVLVGVAVLGCYLAFSRIRSYPWTAVGVGLASLAATCINPGLLHAPRYYIGVFGGAATNDDSGMWSRLSLSNPFDLLLVVAAICLAYMTFRRRRPLWEYAAALGMAGASVLAARHGIWLLLFLAAPAALAFTTDSSQETPPPVRPARFRTVMVAGAYLVAVACVLAVRAPTFRAADAQASQLTAATRGEVVLVAEPLAESMAAAGAKVWVSNPLDAFAHADQMAYLAFMDGDPTSGAFAQADVVVASTGSPEALAASRAGLTRVSRLGAYELLRR